MLAGASVVLEWVGAGVGVVGLLIDVVRVGVVVELGDTTPWVWSAGPVVKVLWYSLSVCFVDGCWNLS